MHTARCVGVRNGDIVITLFWNSGSYSLFTEKSGVCVGTIIAKLKNVCYRDILTENV